jgi:hypothetical protein
MMMMVLSWKEGVDHFVHHQEKALLSLSMLFFDCSDR